MVTQRAYQGRLFHVGGGDMVHISELQNGDVIAVHGTAFWDVAIEDVTRSKYSHVALVVGVNELIEAQGFERVCYRDTGFYVGHADVLRPKAINKKQQGRIVYYASSFLNERYDWLLIGWEALRYVFGLVLPFKERDSKICSTLVADAYRDAGLNICANIKYPSPGDVANSGFFTNLGPLAN
jgi:hypothetical protein